MGELVALAAARFSCSMMVGYFCGAKLSDSCVTIIVPAANTSGGSTAAVGGGGGVWHNDVDTSDRTRVTLQVASTCSDRARPRGGRAINHIVELEM